MITFLIYILIIVLLIISIIHIYWLFGGDKWLDNALPTDIEGNRVLNPSKIETLLAILVFLFFAFFYSLKLPLFNLDLPVMFFKYTGWIISSIFILRSIGDFKYVGFFKKVKHTTFGKLDTAYYSYLSLCIGLIGIVIEIFRNN